MMELKPNAGSDRAWVWNTLADYADECPKPELLAIRFLNAESKYLCIQSNIAHEFSQTSLAWIFTLNLLFTDAQKFKVKFDECKEEVRKHLEQTGTWSLNILAIFLIKCKFFETQLIFNGKISVTSIFGPLMCYFSKVKVICIDLICTDGCCELADTLCSLLPTSAGNFFCLLHERAECNTLLVF